MVKSKGFIEAFLGDRQLMRCGIVPCVATLVQLNGWQHRLNLDLSD